MARGKKLARTRRQQIRSSRIQSYSSVRHKIMHLLEYGVLAPSTHNTQPWKLAIEGNTVNVYADFTKKIPEADPTGRDLYISLGALIRNIELAAHEHNVRVVTNISKTLKNTDLVATLIFNNIENATDPKKSTILDSIVQRQNFRGFFKAEIKSEEVTKIVKNVHTLKVSLQTFFDRQLVEQLAELTAQGLRMVYSKPEFRKEISSFINHNLSRKQHGLHGYSLRLSFPKSVIIPKIMKRKDIGAKLAALNYQSFISAPAVIVLSSRDDERGWLETGLMLEEIMIRLTELGMTASIYAAAIEMGDLRSQLARLIKPPTGHVPQLLFCVGIPTSPLPHSVRKKLTAVLR